jgi:anti-anti-sigma regulatory factor
VTAVTDLEGEAFSTKSVYQAGVLSVALVGYLDLETTPRLRGFLTVVAPEIEAGTIRSVIFDANELYLMSSSAISCFASFLKEVKKLGRPCRITFRTNPTHGWQRRAFEPLVRLADKFATIE